MQFNIKSWNDATQSVWLRDSTGGSFDHLVPLQEEFEVDHIAPLHRGGSFDNAFNDSERSSSTGRERKRSNSLPGEGVRVREEEP